MADTVSSKRGGERPRSPSTMDAERREDYAAGACATQLLAFCQDQSDKGPPRILRYSQNHEQ